MTIFNVFSLLGGLALFLFGMDIMPSQDFHLCSRPPHRFSAIAKLSVPAGPFGFTGFF